jgi:hypothetical protein
MLSIGTGIAAIFILMKITDSQNLPFNKDKYIQKYTENKNNFFRPNEWVIEERRMIYLNKLDTLSVLIL